MQSIITESVYVNPSLLAARCTVAKYNGQQQELEAHVENSNSPIFLSGDAAQQTWNSLQTFAEEASRQPQQSNQARGQAAGAR